jgi:hypothetical protein
MSEGHPRQAFERAFRSFERNRYQNSRVFEHVQHVENQL